MKGGGDIVLMQALQYVEPHHKPSWFVSCNFKTHLLSSFVPLADCIVHKHIQLSFVGWVVRVKSWTLLLYSFHESKLFSGLHEWGKQLPSIGKTSYTTSHQVMSRRKEISPKDASFSKVHNTPLGMTNMTQNCKTPNSFFGYMWRRIMKILIELLDIFYVGSKPWSQLGSCLAFSHLP